MGGIGIHEFQQNLVFQVFRAYFRKLGERTLGRHYKKMGIHKRSELDQLLGVGDPE